MTVIKGSLLTQTVITFQVLEMAVYQELTNLYKTKPMASY